MKLEPHRDISGTNKVWTCYDGDLNLLEHMISYNFDNSGGSYLPILEYHDEDNTYKTQDIFSEPLWWLIDEENHGISFYNTDASLNQWDISRNDYNLSGSKPPTLTFYRYIGDTEINNDLNVAGTLDVSQNLIVRKKLDVYGDLSANDIISHGTITGVLVGSADTLTTARTIGGVSFNGSANIDLPGVNTEGNQNTTGSAAKLTTAVDIGGVSFDGSSDITLPGVNSEGNQNTTGSAAKLTTAVDIGGVSFDGSSDITLPGVNSEGNQNTTGSAATLTTARTIGGVSFNGSANIDLPGVNTEGNQNTTGSAAKLTTAVDIGGVSFDGSSDIDLPGVNMKVIKILLGQPLL